MKVFLTKATTLSVSILAIFTIYAYIFIGGEDDNYYRRFTTPPASSLIVGSSRCAQGIVPEEINKKGITQGNGIFNYCFTNGHSPFGPYYLRSIRKKLSTEKRGLFLVEVNPWTISRRKNTDEGKVKSFREASRFISDMAIVNYMNPNMEYIVKHYSGPYGYDIIEDLLSIRRSHTYLKRSGWLRVDIDMSDRKVKKRLSTKVRQYENLSERWSFSELRLRFLRKTVSTLGSEGKVYMIRMPVSEKMKTVETNYLPTFDEKMSNIAKVAGVKYLNYIDQSGEYSTTDGNHLWKKDARRFSARIANRISDSIRFKEKSVD